DAAHDAGVGPHDAVLPLSVVTPPSGNGVPAPFPAPDDANDANDAASSLSSVSCVVSAPPTAYTVLNSPAAVAAALPALVASPSLGPDTGTPGRAPRQDRLRLVQLAAPEHTYILDAFACDPRTLAEVFTAGLQLIGHNLKFDLQFLAAAGLPVTEGARLF